MNTIQVRRIITFTSLMLFPLTLNYFSPYLSVTGAFDGIISGSVLLFITLLLTSIFFRRTWCSTICPVSAIADYSERINNKNVNRRKLSIIRYSIFTIWFSTFILGFLLSSRGITINPFYLTENLLSIDEPLKFIIYYVVLFILIILTLVIGKRGACHSICWMSPFLVIGSLIGNKLNLPQLRINSNPEACISCSKCNSVCPMSIDVMDELKIGVIQSYDCINCSECENVCPKNVLKLSVSQRRIK